MTHDDQPQPARTPFDALTELKITQITHGRRHPDEPPTEVVYLDGVGRPINPIPGTSRLRLADGERFTATEAGVYFVEFWTDLTVPLAFDDENRQRFEDLVLGIREEAFRAGRHPLPLAPAAACPNAAPRGDILDEIDATIGPCASCSTRLPSNGASPDYCNEDCQKAWFSRKAPSATRPRRAAPYLTNLGREIIGAFTQVLETLRAHISAAFSHIEQSGLPQTIEQQEPTDPMERALWLRRHRNTGPKPRPRRGPRRIDPRGDR